MTLVTNSSICVTSDLLFNILDVARDPYSVITKYINEVTFKLIFFII